MLLNDCLTIHNNNKRPFTCQVENKDFFERSFNSFEEALDKYLEKEIGHGANKEVAERLVARFEDKSVESWAVQIGKWRKGKRKSQTHNINKINEVLDARLFKEEESGKWYVIDKDAPITQKIDRLGSALNKNGISGKEVDDLLLSLRGRALSLSKDLESFADWIQKLRPDDSG